MRRRFLLSLLSVALAAACSSGSHGYGRATEATFMETCAVKQSQPQQICACIYDEIVHRISFDRYVELDKQMQKDPGFVPDELIPIGADCASRPTTSSS